MSQTHEVQQSLDEVKALLARLEMASWRSEDWGMLQRVLRSYERLLSTLVEAQITLKRLQTLLFGKRRPRRHRGVSGALEAPAGEVACGDTAAAGALCGDDPARGAEARSALGMGGVKDEGTPPRAGGHRPGYGRLGAEAYAGAERVACRHEELAVGQRCPVCGQGTLYELPPGSAIRIDGHALLSAIRYALQKLRCSACGQIFTASLPPEAGEDKYSPRARAVLAIGRYYLGLPLYRLQSYQAMLGVPVADATQWDQIEKVGDCSYVVFAYLETLAAQGELIYQDDTSVRILTLLKENQERQVRAAAMGFARSQERTGMFTTALVVKVGERILCLYYSGRSHAGENLAALLEQRKADHGKPLVMSDALSRNEVDETTVIRCHCLAHGRRQFSDLEAVFPVECRVVLDVLKQVFDHDEQAREERLSSQARLAYHQQYSRPLMEGLKQWLEQQFAERLVEPNSSLGKAMTYMQSHWETLTRFLQVEGAPLDNNVVERALKLFIRQRHNSLFYKNEHSAYIASVLTSLIATCIYAGGNVLDYLVALQEHRAEVFADPSAWLPWTYQARLAPS